MSVEHVIRQRISRRELQKLMLTAPAPLSAAIALGRTSGLALAQNDAATPASDAPLLAPTPECQDDEDLDLTQSQTEGPYFTPDSPERTSLLEEGMAGRELLFTGYVYSAACTPVSKALLDFWHCDDAGIYDNDGYRLRGHQFTDADGRFELTTIVPGIYPGRTRHIHLKVQAPGGPVLTTQVYFPDEPENDRDGLFDERLVMHVESDESRDIAFYTFVVEEA